MLLRIILVSSLLFGFFRCDRLEFNFGKNGKSIAEARNATDEVIQYVTLNETELELSYGDRQKVHKYVNAPLLDQEDPLFSYNSSDCPFEEWNQVRTDSIANGKLHEEWAGRNVGNYHYLYDESPGPLAAFVYPDQIIVTLTAENYFNKTVFCRYYDCRRREIPDQFEAIVFPESTVFCARRKGAKYISISETIEETPEWPVPIVSRLEKPPHYFTVCMATLYGDEPKFLQIVDFIEYYKLQGATFFHIYLRNVSDYDRILLDDYARTGEIEIIKMHNHYWRDDWMWHHVQINDCHHRNKYFSKWTALVDVDERIEMRSDEFKIITHFLDTVHDPNVSNLHMKIQWVIKDSNTPARYVDDEQLWNEMLHHKYQNTSRVGNFWTQPKCIIRPEKVGAMTIHTPLTVYSGVRRTLVNETIAVVRHYRNVEQRVFAGALDRMLAHAPFEMFPIPEWIDQKLSQAILDRVKWVYKVDDVECDKKQFIYHNHNGINASCWLEQQKNGLDL